MLMMDKGQEMTSIIPKKNMCGHAGQSLTSYSATKDVVSRVDQQQHIWLLTVVAGHSREIEYVRKFITSLLPGGRGGRGNFFYAPDTK